MMKQSLRSIVRGLTPIFASLLVVPATALAADGTYRAIYEFEDPPHSLTAADSSGYGNTMALNGLIFGPGHTGEGLQLQGGSLPQTAASASLTLPEALTVEAWIQGGEFLNSYPAGGALFEITVPNLGNPSSVFFVAVNPDGTLHMQVNGEGTVGTCPVFNSSQFYTIPLAWTISNNQAVAPPWMHVAASYDGMNARLFINGVNVGTSPCTTGPLANMALPKPLATFSLGNVIGQSGFSTFGGTVDEVRITWGRSEPFLCPGNFSGGASAVPQKAMSDSRAGFCIDAASTAEVAYGDASNPTKGCGLRGLRVCSYSELISAAYDGIVTPLACPPLQACGAGQGYRVSDVVFNPGTLFQYFAGSVDPTLVPSGLKIPVAPALAILGNTMGPTVAPMPYYCCK
jgi:Concanavalin A-like lectin/glucanases superfamily